MTHSESTQCIRMFLVIPIFLEKLTRGINIKGNSNVINEKQKIENNINFKVDKNYKK